MDSSKPGSDLKGFRHLSPSQRLALVKEVADLSDQETIALSGENALSDTTANGMIENVIGKFELPLGVATNFMINGCDYLIPMACLLYTSPSPRDQRGSRMPSSA